MIFPFPPKQSGFLFETSSSQELTGGPLGGISGTFVLKNYMTQEKFRLHFKAVGVGISAFPLPSFSYSTESMFSTGSPVWLGPRGSLPFSLGSLASSLTINSFSLAAPSDDGRPAGSGFALVRFGATPFIPADLIIPVLSAASTTAFFTMGGDLFGTKSLAAMYYYGAVHSIVNVT